MFALGRTEIIEQDECFRPEAAAQGSAKKKTAIFTGSRLFTHKIGK